MSNLRSTAVMKTDMRGFTVNVRTLSESDLSSLLKQHKQFILDIAAKHGGGLVKGEGDAFWMTFPSVTAAARAATEIHEELRFTQSGKGDDARLAVRIIIALGDVLHHENDIFGDTVNLAARIEKITPPDEIYLSQAAWLTLNRAEVRTSYVNEFSLKGISEPVKVYRIDQEHRTRIIRDQAIVFSDLHGYTAYTASFPVEEVEKLLIHHETLHNQACEMFGGTIRQFLGDACLMTFPESQAAVGGVEFLTREWDNFARQNRISCSIKVAVHKGDLYLFRSYLYGKAINATSRLTALAGELTSTGKNYVLISGQVRDEITGSEWETRLCQIELPEDRPVNDSVKMSIYEFCVVDAAR